MPDTIVWTGQSGKQELIRDLHENHLMNAYAKCVREDINADKRPALAAEIDARGLTDQLPAYAAAVLGADLPAQEMEMFPY